MSPPLRYGHPQEVGLDPARVALMRQRCREWVERGVTPSLVALVARRGVIALHEAAGVMGPEPDAPSLSPDAIFAVGSFAKPMTAALVMQLVEDGLVGLNRPVQEYLPGFVGEGKEAVMVHHLLTHTSGLRDESAPLTSPTYHAYLEAVLAAPLTTAPGREMSYWNGGYTLLGEIVRALRDEPLPLVFRRYLFDPLGMHDSSLCGPVPPDRYVRRPPDAPFAELIERMLSAPRPNAAGALFSSAHDVAVFGQMILGRGCYGDARVLSSASVAAMTRNQIPGVPATYGREVFPEASWGLGFNVCGGKMSFRDGALHSASALSHGGIGQCYLLIDPAHDLVVVYLSVATEQWTYRKSDWRADALCDMALAAVED